MSAPVRVALVSCSKLKGPREAPARELYRSPLFRVSLAWAEATHENVRIVSALYYMVRPDQRIEPYDRTLRMMKPGERCAWGQRAIERLAAEFPGQALALSLLAGDYYRSALEGPALARGWKVESPLGNANIGRRIRKLNTWIEELQAAARANRCEPTS